MRDLAVGQHDLQGEHVRAGDARGEAVRPARVVRHVAADRARLLARRVRGEEEPERRELPVQVEVDHPGLDPRHPRGLVDRQDPVHLRGDDDDGVADAARRRRRARCPRRGRRRGDRGGGRPGRRPAPRRCRAGSRRPRRRRGGPTRPARTGIAPARRRARGPARAPPGGRRPLTSPPRLSVPVPPRDMSSMPSAPYTDHGSARTRSSSRLASSPTRMRHSPARTPSRMTVAAWSAVMRCRVAEPLTHHPHDALHLLVAERARSGTRGPRSRPWPARSPRPTCPRAPTRRGPGGC